MYDSMINIKLIEMRKKVKEEIEHIPKGDIHQNLLRQIYSVLRMNSLGKKPKSSNNKDEILKLAIKEVTNYTKTKGIKFNSDYDKNYFK